MNLSDIGSFINDNGLAILILIAIMYSIYKILTPYLTKKLDKSVEKDGELEGKVSDRYFKLIDNTIKDAKVSNEKLMIQLEGINDTNKMISETNKQLVENFEQRITKIELVNEDIKEVVIGINTKIDNINK